ncbi:MAG: Na+/H+ antiporter NhaA, partial [Planctomycetota bacterium]
MADRSFGHSDLVPTVPIDRVAKPVVRFMHVEAASGIVLLTATAAALFLANSPWAEGFLAFWKTEFTLGFGPRQMTHSLQHWINDGLMAIFFFVVGLEVKREIVLGELRDPRAAVLPLAAAIGGMVVPAGLYLALQYGDDGVRGWGIPMATDIAFVVGAMALLGRRVPHILRVTVLSLAIVDDIGAILVIAIGYTDHVDLLSLALGVAGILAIVILSRLGVRSLIVFSILGIEVWLAFHESGVHATIAGVILGLMTPARSYLSDTVFGKVLERASEIVKSGTWAQETGRGEKVLKLQKSARETISPLEYLEASLHPWVAYAVMPLFAFANAGVPFQASYLTNEVAVAVVVGLVVGKPLGVVGVT